MTSSTDKKLEPCGSEDCDRCDPRPRWKVSQHRLQHLTYTRKIKATTAEEALQIFEAGTAWPTQYDDDYGAVVQLDAPTLTQLPPDEYYLTECCFHNLSFLDDDDEFTVTAPIKDPPNATTPPAEVLRGLVALSAALTAPQAEHPDVLAACAWIAQCTENRENPS